MKFRRVISSGSLIVAGLTMSIAPVAAHSGTTHAGTPHGVLFFLFIGGLCAMVGAGMAARRTALSLPLIGILLTGGAIAAVFGGIGLVEMQVVGQTPPKLVAFYPVLSVLIAGTLSIGGFLFVRFKYPTKPQYALLCLLLAGWIAYPTVMPNQGYYHPLGYLLVVSLPFLVAYIIWTDARGVLQSLRLQLLPKVIGTGASLLMSIFFAFSAGTMSFNPDTGINAPTKAFLIPYQVASPLVVWPAVEWYFPSIPFTGFLSVGTLVLMGVLGGLIGLNVAVVVQQWSTAGSIAGKQLFSGSLAASGATACCCCAPAFYGALSVLFGTAVTPVYWSFMIPSSPVGSTFFAVSVLLLLGSFLQSTGGSPSEVRSSLTTPQ